MHPNQHGHIVVLTITMILPPYGLHHSTPFPGGHRDLSLQYPRTNTSGFVCKLSRNRPWMRNNRNSAGAGYCAGAVLPMVPYYFHSRGAVREPPLQCGIIGFRTFRFASVSLIHPFRPVLPVPARPPPGCYRPVPPAPISSGHIWCTVDKPVPGLHRPGRRPF